VFLTIRGKAKNQIVISGNKWFVAEVVGESEKPVRMSWPDSKWQTTKYLEPSGKIRRNA